MKYLARVYPDPTIIDSRLKYRMFRTAAVWREDLEVWWTRITGLRVEDFEEPGLVDAPDAVYCCEAALYRALQQAIVEQLFRGGPSVRGA